MTTLPYVFTATPEDPATCQACRIEKDHGDFVEYEWLGIVCATCITTGDTALTVHSMERDGHAPPTEEENHGTHP
jgi:hypothetical protein